VTYLSGFAFPDGTSLYNGPFVEAGPRGEGAVRELARQRLVEWGGYFAKRANPDTGKVESYFRPVAECEREGIVQAVYIVILPFRGSPE